MSAISVLVLLQAALTFAAPLPFPFLQPQPGTFHQQQLALEEQMLAMQQFQAMQRLSAIPQPMAISPSQPLLLLFPNPPPSSNQDHKHTKDHLKSQIDYEVHDEDSDSITIEASDPIDRIDAKRNPMRAFVLLPNNARFSLGGLISGIPFLPVEVNVPDSISWIYDGISSIISGLGQRWPFKRPQTGESQTEGMNMKGNWKEQMKQTLPVVIMPIGPGMLPMLL